MPRADKNINKSVEIELEKLGYKISDWNPNVTFNKEIEEVLSTASKRQTNEKGIPDRIFFDADEKLLILVEEKQSIKDHDNPDITQGAISGIKWYLSRFLNRELNKNHKNLVNYFNSYNIIGIAVSGNLQDDYGHKFDCFVIDRKRDDINSINYINSFVDEDSFLSIFNNTNIEEKIQKISSTTKKINNLLRSIDSQKRPILLSALMICLHKTAENGNNFCDYYKTIQNNLLSKTIIDVCISVLKKENIPEEKLKILKTELGFLEIDTELNSERNNTLKYILNELEEVIIPLFNDKTFVKSNYDIIGTFYEEFLKYAGISNVKKGIVLTPRHITTLFTKLIDIKPNDRIVDLCCGTGAFLIAGMNALIDKINNSELPNKQELIKNVKTNQLLGFEVNTTMYICAISNMLFRGDGKSSIHNCSSIKNNEADNILQEFQPTIGFINPPYSGKENSEDPTPKEITFLIKLLDNCSRYALMIAPLSVYNKLPETRTQILQKHTLKAVINMPKDLFAPNANTNTAICVFETNRPFDYNEDEVIFYDLQDDGFVLNKNAGRTDIYNKWKDIEKSLLDDVVKGKNVPDNIKFVKTRIKKRDEWCVYAFSKTDYSGLTTKPFIKVIKEFLSYKAKKDLNILNNEEMDEIDRINFLFSYYGDNLIKSYNIQKIDTCNWKEFQIGNDNGLFNVENSRGDIQTKNRNFETGDKMLISSGKYNNGFIERIEKNIKDKSQLFNKNSITIDMFGNVFYQDEEFYAVSHGRVNVLIPKFDANKYVLLFIVAMIRNEQYRFSYGRGVYQEESEDIVIKLPSTPQGQPDFEYMEKFMKKLPYGDLL